ncbi:MAG: deoxyribose-phosphate aldolase [Bacteroidia bacterium]|nr:deoxyribose-phosphate aldolase [Bacteroidia bacterium]
MDKKPRDLELAPYIEQTLLRMDATKEEIQDLCIKAMGYKFYGVCIPPYYVKFVREIIKDNNLKIITVVGFPMGYQTMMAKQEEAKRALQDGADEIDMVMNVAAFKSKEYSYIKEELENLATICRLKSKPLKVIIEVSLLSEEEIRKICEICAEVKVDFVKTSTGFNGGGAKIEHIKLMRKILPEKIKIKASGGIRQKKFAEKLIKAGASRIGTSAGEMLIKD